MAAQAEEASPGCSLAPARQRGERSTERAAEPWIWKYSIRIECSPGSSSRSCAASCAPTTAAGEREYSRAAGAAGTGAGTEEEGVARRFVVISPQWRGGDDLGLAELKKEAARIQSKGLSADEADDDAPLVFFVCETRRLFSMIPQYY